MTMQTMKRLTGRGLLAVALTVVAGDHWTAQGAAPPAVTLLPKETAALVSLADVPDVAERIMNTALGQMSQDPQMRPVVDNLYGKLAERFEDAQDRIGLSLAELRAIPQGEVTLALVVAEEGPPELVLVVDAGDHIADARRLVDKATEELERSGAGRMEETVLDTDMVLFDRVGPQMRRLTVFEKDGAVVVGSNAEVLKGMLAVWNGQEAATLADDASFNAVMRHCQGDQDERPQAVWYVNPLLLIEGIARDNTGLRMATTMMPVLGLNGLVGAGGSIAWDVEGFDSVVHSHLLLDSPRRGALDVVSFGSGEGEPEPWVPEGVGSYSTFYWQPQKIYEKIATLYDGFRGEGALSAAVGRRMGRLAEFDFEKDVLPTLDGRLTHMTWIARPVTLTSQATFVGLKIKDPRALAKVLDKVVVENGPFLNRQTYGGETYFEFSPPQIGEEPARVEQPGRPRPCFGLIEGYLMIADRPAMLEAVIRTAADPRKSLSRSADYKAVAEELHRRAGGETAMLSFERPEEGLRLVYQLAIDESPDEQFRRRARRNPFLRTISTALEDQPLPPFAVIEQYLTPQGAAITEDASGFHYMGFSLKEKP